MGCLYTFFAIGVPRFAVLLLWMARPTYFTAALGGSIIWPLIGLFFLPLTTLMYSLLWVPGAGVTGWEWLLVIAAFLLDIGALGGIGYVRRRQGSGYTGS